MPVARLVANITQTNNQGKINGHCLVLKPVAPGEQYPKLFATPLNINCLDVSLSHLRTKKLSGFLGPRLANSDHVRADNAFESDFRCD